MHRFTRYTAALAIAVAALALGACSSSKTTASGTNSGLSGSSGSAGSCAGDPVKVMTISTLSGGLLVHPEIPEATKAAAAAVTKSCELGRPVSVVVCDDKFDPNAAGECAREAVSEKVMAVIGDDGQFTDTTLPILKAAGIADFGFYQNGTQASSSPNSFPFLYGLSLVRGEIASAVSLGAKQIAFVSLNTPQIQFLVNLGKSQIEGLGAKLVASITVPANVTDLSTATAQVVSSKADAVIPILPNGPVLQLLNELTSQGTSLDKIAVISTSINVTPGVIKQWGSVADGLYLIGGAAPIGDTSNPGIAQMVDELKAAGGSADDQSDRGVAGWSAMHVMADLMKGSTTFDAATFASKLGTVVVDRPELPKIDFSKPAYTDATLAKLRIYTSQAILERVVNGQAEVVTSGGFVSTENPFIVSQ